MEIGKFISYVGVLFIVVAILLPTSIQLQSFKKSGVYGSFLTKLGNKDKSKSKTSLFLLITGLLLLSVGISY
jgi:hypothetical protein